MKSNLMRYALFMILAVFLVSSTGGCKKKVVPPKPPARVAKPAPPAPAPTPVPPKPAPPAPKPAAKPAAKPAPKPLPPAPKPAPPKPKPVAPPSLTKLDTIYFDFDKSNIRQDQSSTIAKNANFLKQPVNANLKITLEGHCDERGTDEYNMALGDRRANSSKKYLIRMGVSAGNIKTISYGESRPAKQGHNEGAWKFNRRAEFLVR